MALHPYYWSTALLLNFEDASSTTFTDISPTPKTPSSVNGSAANSATQFKTGTKSLVVDGTTAYLDYATDAGYDFGSGAFTVSLWYRPATITGTQSLVYHGIAAAAADADIAFFLWVVSGKAYGRFNIGGAQKNIIGLTTLTIGQWHHIEYSRDDAGVTRLFLDGVSDTGSISYPGIIQTPASRIMRIGRYSTANPYYANGYIDGLTITKGYADHTATFTPNAAVYTATPPTTGSAAVTLPMFTGSAVGGGFAGVSLPMLTAVASGGATAQVLLPMFAIRATGHDSTGERTASVVLPMFQIEARGGAVAQMNLPMFNIASTGTVPVTINARVMLPMFDIEARGTVGTVGSARVTLPMFTGKGVGGGHASVDIPMFQIEAGGTTGIIGSASVVLPMFDIESRGTMGIVITAHVVLPMIESVRPSSAHVLLPMFGIVAIGHATVTITYEAYCVNLKPGNKAGIHEVTRWTDLPFDGIVRHGNNYYGWGEQGLHLIGGATDNTAPVAWAWKTAITDFGTSQKKALREMVFSGRIGPTAVA
jgi:hypothetical protein